ncbi:MAG: hypothetical protein HKN35_05745 [Woeseia sp.]|nr:hypothetical protein [Woeseia sp.]MBT8096809.1 hypothetical protein [Woeseia sp.]NNE60372.1 hypothetical protein [Woeseia sp.]NNL53786.1 hypothetical protein [Woeseia sp.]
MWRRRVILLAIAANVISACAASLPMDGEPAVIVNPDSASRAELKAVVQTALHGASTMLAADALTQTSVLMIDLKPPRGLDAPQTGGRLMEPGETFHLFLDGRQCVLKQQSTGLRWLLMDTECAAEKTTR